MNRKLIIGTRGSQLALWQANFVKDRLAEIGIESELKIIKTQGDIIQHLRLDKLEGKGFYQRARRRITQFTNRPRCSLA